MLAGVKLQRVAIADPQGVLAKPEEVCPKDVRLDGQILGMACDLATFDENLLLKGDADGLTGAGGKSRTPTTLNSTVGYRASGHFV